ncbi:MAG: hypothetical protein KGM24_00795 [Elusimicrobia bacterium]|nr:hypothetical protein [Elusimicrobiota bacterium]
MGSIPAEKRAEESVVVSAVEIVRRVPRAGGTRWIHCRWTEEGWKPCFHCGDLVGVTEFSRGGLFPTVDEIRRTCSRFGRY